jgi:type VI secretion system protein ImpF
MLAARETLAVQSLMDRLTTRDDWPMTRTASLRFLKESIRRDLERLLNTRQPHPDELGGYELTRNSVLNYGLPDLNSLNTSSRAHLQQVQVAVQNCIELFEPRLEEVTVSVEHRDLGKREIRFHIEARLVVHQMTDTVSFDSLLDLTSGTYAVN